MTAQPANHSAIISGTTRPIASHLFQVNHTLRQSNTPGGRHGPVRSVRVPLYLLDALLVHVVDRRATGSALIL